MLMAGHCLLPLGGGLHVVPNNCTSYQGFTMTTCRRTVMQP